MGMIGWAIMDGEAIEARIALRLIDEAVVDGV